MLCKINKELFEAVYNCDVSIDNDMRAQIRLLQGSEARQDSFFFKCKEWALKQGYELVTWTTSGHKGYCNIFSQENFLEELCRIETSSEKQAVFDGCQWILGNKAK